MSTIQQRLDAYLAAEARILTRGFSTRYAERQRQEAELSAIQRGIRDLQAQLDAQANPGRAGSLRYKTAVFNR